MSEDKQINETKETKGGKGRTAWRIAVAACLILIAAAVIMRLMKPEDPIETSPLSTVSVTMPEHRDISIETSLVGTVMPDNIYYVIPKVAGEIREIYVSQGDQVNEGDPICRIDNDAQVDSAKISLDAAKVQLSTAELSAETARTNYERMNTLYGTGDISKQNWESAKSGYEQAQAALDAARLQVEAAQLAYDLQLKYSTVTAPVGGTVESTNMELNAMASQSSQLCVISGAGTQKVQFSVTDRLLSGIAVGDPIRLEKQGMEYEGTVTLVETIPSSSTGLYPVEANIEGGSSLVTGSGIKVYFTSDSTEDALTIPTDAIYYDGGLTYAYTLSYDEGAEELGEGELISSENKVGTVHKVQIETGLSDGQFTEILSGISEEDLIISSWTAQLYEGATVQVLPELLEDTDISAEEAMTDGDMSSEGAAELPQTGEASV